LIIGTGFPGPHLAEAARRRGHTVTLVNRVTRGNVQKLKDEHNTEVGATEGQQWDGVIDLSAHVPADIVRMPAAVVSGAGRFLLLSSTGVYAKLDKPGIDETAPVAKTDNPHAPKATDKDATALKALCETAAEKAMPGRVCVIRSGLIVGPDDPSGRFTYWPVRVARGGDVLAPGKPSDFVQFIDVRDLADFIVLCAERKIHGTYNVDGRAGAMTIGALLETCKKVSKSDARFVWADATFFAERAISYRDMPVWAPAGGDYIGFGQVSSAKAQAAGLRYRPLEETVKDTLAWYRAQAAAQKILPLAGLAPKREADLLKALRRKKA
jgi:2'-hydroxyisoflavone reductase